MCNIINIQIKTNIISLQGIKKEYNSLGSTHNQAEFLPNQHKLQRYKPEENSLLAHLRVKLNFRADLKTTIEEFYGRVSTVYLKTFKLYLKHNFKE